MYRETHRVQLGKVHDPYLLFDSRMKSTISHLPATHTFGVACGNDTMGVCELVGNTPPVRMPAADNIGQHGAAGLRTLRSDDLDQQRHIVPKIRMFEDQKLMRKITEDLVGGKVNRLIPDCVFGLATVRSSNNGPRPVRKLADSINYGDELGAKGLIYPSHRNVYGVEQIARFEAILRASNCDQL